MEVVQSNRTQCRKTKRNWWQRICQGVIIGTSISMLSTLPAMADSRHLAEFIGTCDASAAVPLGDGRFIVAGDENSRLNIYDWRAPGESKVIDLVGIIPGLTEEQELDLEGAATIGDTSYWISSHSRTKGGKLSLERHIFFALKFTQNKGETEAHLVGKAYKNLLKDLTENELYRKYKFENFDKSREAEKAGESEAGFNIEGLSAWKEGKIWKLLLGLRGPLEDKKAMLIPLENPREVIEGKRPRFGKVVKLDLDGLGIRGIEFNPGLNKYVILGGSVGKKEGCNIYIWSGKREDGKPGKVKGVTLVDKFNPEAVFALPDLDKGSVYVLSDDGNQKYHGIKCKDLEESGRIVFFRGFKLTEAEALNTSTEAN